MSLVNRLRDYDKKAKILKKFNPFESRVCPPRLEVNVYTGCAYQCKYCYARAYIISFHIPRCKANFEENLKNDVQRAIQMGLNELPVSISNSCEPFQPLEDGYKHTLLTIKLLTENKFPLIVITKNPSKLLEPEYFKAMDSRRTFIEVTIPFLDSKFFEPNAPLTQDRIEAVAKLIELGYVVAARFDPIIPRYRSIPGQSPSEVKELVEKLHDAGVKFVIAKCLRLVGATAKVYPEFYYGLRPYYIINGTWTGNCYELKDEVKQKLHIPVYQSCQENGIQYSTCLDDVHFPGSVRCDRSGTFLCDTRETCGVWSLVS